MLKNSAVIANGNAVAIKALLTFTAVLFLVCSATLIRLQQKFVKAGTQELWDEYNLTSILGYGYVRIILHATTKRRMEKTSTSYRSLPSTRADDTAWSIINAMSFLLWAPILSFFIVQAFILADRDRYDEELSPFARMICATYVVDHVMQKVVFVDAQRLIHHTSCAIIILIQFEWLQTAFNPLAILLGILDVAAKILWYFQACQRLSRAHAKEIVSAYQLPNTTGATHFAAPNIMRLDDLEITGSDRFFIWVEPKAAANLARVTFAIFPVLGGWLLPAACMLSNISLNGDDFPLFWKIISPLALLIFSVLDYPLYQWLWARTKVTYWECTIFKTEETTKETETDKMRATTPKDSFADSAC